MAIALKSVLRSQQLPLILRAAAFGGALALLRIFPGNAAVVFLFVLVALISYLTPFFNSGKFFGVCLSRRWTRARTGYSNRHSSLRDVFLPFARHQRSQSGSSGLVAVPAP